MVFNMTINNISVISWQSVLLVEETGVPGGKPANLNHIMLYQVHLAWVGFELFIMIIIIITIRIVAMCSYSGTVVIAW
jgi:hypothetical protein